MAAQPVRVDGIEVPAVAVDEGDDLAAAQQAAEEAAGGPVCAVETDRSMERAEVLIDRIADERQSVDRGLIHEAAPAPARDAGMGPAGLVPAE